MERKTFLALGGLALLPGAALAAERRTLRVKDAPTRTVLELVLKGFDQRNYLIENTVGGFLSGDWQESRVDETLNRICTRNEPKLSWAQDNATFVIKATTPYDFAKFKARIDTARLPVVQGISCRVPAILDGGEDRWAILESGDLAHSVRHDVVRVGNRVPIYVRGEETAEYLVVAIERDHVGLVLVNEHDAVLKGGPRKLRVPFAAWEKRKT